MRIEVSREQRHLKEQQTDRPHGRTSAEPRQDRLAQQRLHLKEQKSAQESRHSEHDSSIADGESGLAPFRSARERFEQSLVRMQRRQILNDKRGRPDFASKLNMSFNLPP
jgi:phosphopantetheinyl transferase